MPGSSEDQLPVSERKLGTKPRCAAAGPFHLPALPKANDCTRILKVREQVDDRFLVARQNQAWSNISERPKHKGS